MRSSSSLRRRWWASRSLVTPVARGAEAGSALPPGMMGGIELMRFCASVMRWPPWAAGPVGGLKGFDEEEGAAAALRGDGAEEMDARGPVGTTAPGPVGGVAGEETGAGAKWERGGGAPHPPRPREL